MAKRGGCAVLMTESSTGSVEFFEILLVPDFACVLKPRQAVRHPRFQCSLFVVTCSVFGRVNLSVSEVCGFQRDVAV